MVIDIHLKTSYTFTLVDFDIALTKWISPRLWNENFLFLFWHNFKLTFLVFHNLDIFKIIGHLLFRMFLNLSDVSSWLHSRFVSLAEKSQRRSCVPLIASYVVLPQNLICPISSEVNLNHMIELVSARFSHCKVPFSPFLLNLYCFLFQLVVFGFFFFLGGRGGSGGGMYLKPL